MKNIKYKFLLIFLLTTIFFAQSNAQCSICTKTAAQLGEKPAKALNGAIIYLMLAPLAIMATIGYIWYKNNKKPFEQ